jgi:phosphatidylglycerol---prolipoprotein diacylglyceryl transferase
MINIPVIFWKGRSFNLVNFGIFAALGAMLGYSVSFFYLQSRGISVSRFCWEMALILCLFNLLFAKLYAMFSIGVSDFFRNIRRHLNETSFYQQGGMIGTITGALLLIFLLDIPVAVLGDSLCLGGIVIMAVGRIGCHCYGCCTGKPVNGHFGIRYTDPNAKICRDHPELLNAPLLPAQLISSAIDFLIFVLCCVVSVLYPFSGLIMVVFFISFNLKRIAIQHFRIKPANNKIPYRLIAFLFIVFLVLIMLIFHYEGESFFEQTPSEIPFTPISYFRFWGSDLNVLASLIFVFMLNFAAYGIHGRRIGTHFNLAV